MTTFIILSAIAITFNSDLERVYNFVSDFLFGGKKLTPKEF